MKIKLKKKTRKRLKKLTKTARRVSAVLAADVIAELAAALERRGTDITERLDQRLRATGDHRSEGERASDERAGAAPAVHEAEPRTRDDDADRELEHRLPRTADHN